MKRIHWLFTFICQVSLSLSALAQGSRSLSFDADWRFEKGKLDGAEVSTYIDSRWRKISLPHDWSIEDLPGQLADSVSGPFAKSSIGGTATGFTIGGTGWYRKRFVTPKTAQLKKTSIQFDGVYMDSDVWINGYHLGNHPYGYTPFQYDLTPYLQPVGKENVLAVRVRNEGKNSRWYSGSGIYRHVWLIITDPIRVAPWGVAITTPDVAADKATVLIKTKIENRMPTQKSVVLITTLLSPDGKAVGRSQQNLALSASGHNEQTQQVSVVRPTLWAMETPRLYKAVTEIKETGGRLLDKTETVFGIRSIQVDAQHGLRISVTVLPALLPNSAFFWTGPGSTHSAGMLI